MRSLLLLGILFVMTFNGYAGDNRYEKLPYNTKSHSIREHCKLIAGCYSLSFNLNRKERIGLYKDLRNFYHNQGVKNATTSELHSFISDKMKNYLTVNQYDRFKNMTNYFEFIFADGAPAVASINNSPNLF
jgi:hypothetical protein